MIDRYKSQLVCIATKHGKEKVIARPLVYALGLDSVVPPELDTDSLGTFSGEVERKGTMSEVCLHKARLGMQAAGTYLGIASEGSFGPHPRFFFIPGGIEVMTFEDDESGFAVTESFVTEKTNFAHCETRDCAEIAEWLTKVKFPSHALIVRSKSDPSGTYLAKGIQSMRMLRDAVAHASETSEDGLALIETDMRAHLNPLRMASIRKLAFRLARRIATTCPGCGLPGWGRTDVVVGLPCESCGSATENILREVFTCVKCSQKEEIPRSDGIVCAPAQHCPVCNP